MWKRNLTTQYFSLSHYSNTNMSLRIELNQRKHLIYKLKRIIKTKNTIKSTNKVNVYNIDELGYYSRQTFNCWKDLFSIADSEKQGNLILNSLPSGLLRCRGLLNHLASFVKTVSACAKRQFTQNTHTTENYYTRCYMEDHNIGKCLNKASLRKAVWDLFLSVYARSDW
jgi:hypothetical protein